MGSETRTVSANMLDVDTSKLAHWRAQISANAITFKLCCEEHIVVSLINLYQQIVCFSFWYHLLLLHAL
jgi:hypothetical protein